MDIQVELRPHIGKQPTAFGPIEVEHNQWMIFARREGGPMLHVGYVGKQPNAPINFLRQPNGQPWPEAVKEIVRQAIAEECGDGSRSEAEPPEPEDPEKSLEEDILGDED